jgi:hypothetical protein
VGPVITPKPGLMAFHTGKPIEFLHLISISNIDRTQTWMAKPLFIANPVTTTITWRPGDRMSLLHTTRA